MVKTNKDSLLKEAVIGQITHTAVEPRYTTTWDGKPKLAVGGGGIVYNVKIGDPCFGWASGEKVEPGVSADGIGSDGERGSFRNFCCIGNEAKVMGGMAKGATGIIIGKMGYLPDGVHHVLIHFKDEDLEKLSIGDKVQVKAWGTGLQFEDVKGVKILSASPNLIDSMGLKSARGGLTVPVTKIVPADLVGQGHGGSPPESSNWDIQTCNPEAITSEGLDKLRLGDVVALKDILSLYGMGCYESAWTVGVVSSGASDLAGQGIGVVPILTSMGDELKPEIDAKANIAYYLGIRKP